MTEMKAIDWQKFLQEQRDRHGKVVFTPTELANASSQEWPALKGALSRLVAQGVIERYVEGRYGLPGAVAVEDLVHSLDPAAYVSGIYALYRHQLITQVPAVINCLTDRRHNRSRVRMSSLGRIVFTCVTGSSYAYPNDGILAPPEQALCDHVYLCRKRGVDSSSIVTFRNLDRLDIGKLQAHLSKYPRTVSRTIVRILPADYGRQQGQTMHPGKSGDFSEFPGPRW